MILGYNLFRTMANPKSKSKASIRKVYDETLMDPGEQPSESPFCN